MTKTFFAGVVTGMIGGVVGAFLVIHLDPSRTMPSPASAATTHPQDVISTNRIRLMDAGGKVRAELATSGDGGPALFFYDSAGRNRMVFTGDGKKSDVFGSY
jgi:hypothetical protein